MDSTGGAGAARGDDGRIAVTTARGPLQDVPPETPVPKPDDFDALTLQAESPAVNVAFGPFVSRQVNVNASGNNIVGDAANEPSMAVDLSDPKRIAIGWRQFNTISNSFRQAGVAYTTDGGLTWTFPGVLQPGVFRSDPVLGADGFGTLYYSSLSSLSSVEVFRSYNGGATWLGPVPAFGGDKQWMTVDRRNGGLGAGHLYQIWNVQFTCCFPDDFTRSVDGGLTFPSSHPLPQPSMKWGTLDTGPEGTLYLAGATLDQTPHLFARSTNAKDPAQAPSFEVVQGIDLGGFTGGFGSASPNPAGLLGQVWIKADPSRLGRLFVLASVSGGGIDPIDVMFIRSVDNGAHWTAPQRINDDSPGTNAWQWFGTMSVAPKGRIDVVWNDTRTTGAYNRSALFYSSSDDAGRTWSANVQVSPVFNSHVGFPSQNKIGDYYDMVSDNGGANVAYSATFNGEQDVYFLRIPRDCDGNGIEDDCDVQCGAPGTRCAVAGCGTRPDCNFNGIPDGCEPNTNCNGNATMDLCEIGANPALDCNENNILDSCEPSTDCNGSFTPDACDLFGGSSADCNRNGVPDEFDIAGQTSLDADNDGVPDECVGACCVCGCTERTDIDCVVRSGDFSGSGSVCGGSGSCSPTPPATNDDCATAEWVGCEVTDGIVPIPFDNRCATTDGPDPVPCASDQPFGADLWYKCIPTVSGVLTASTCGSTSMDGILALYEGDVGECPCPSNNAMLLTCGDDTCGVGGGPAAVTMEVEAGRCYLIRVGGWSGAIGVGELTVTLDEPSLQPPDSPPPDAAGSHLRKNRYISMVVPEAADQTALRVKMTSLHHPPAPPGAPNFTAFEGQYRYVNTIRDAQNNPVLTCPDSAVRVTSFRCAVIGCQPEYRNWGAELNGAVLHVTGQEIVPSSMYDVAHLAASCQGHEETCAGATVELRIATSLWGDVVESDPPLAVLDVAAEVDKVKDLATGTLMKPRAQIQGDMPSPRANVNVLDIANAVDALKDKPYPFGGPQVCP